MSRAAVIRFPGSNCEFETARALKNSGLNARIYNWNDIELLSDNRADAYVLPGGFSFQDRIRAGVVASRESIMDLIFEEAVNGKPILGICNGAQVLLESGLVPGWKPGSVQGALAGNLAPGRSGYLSGWINLKPASEAIERCPWLCAMSGEPIPVPFAHAEGRFVFRKEDTESVKSHIGLTYCEVDGSAPDGYPANPNGSALDVAALMNVDGNVLAMMPHPERSFYLWQVPPDLKGPWGDMRRNSSLKGLEDQPGPGAIIFKSLAKYLGGNNG
ncbi:MAG: phosphoribosylformylglycinamidine synthase I [Candidatus Sabulitectum sp.]|nr:phosphoribosylformylglycinamidine synthase I [Candidatus Sabulitectum sp.]